MKPCLPIRSGRLRPATTDDAPHILELLHRPQVRLYLCDDKLLAPGDVEAMLDDSAVQDSLGLGIWIIEQEPKRFAGIVGLALVPDEIAHLPGMSGGIEPTVALEPRLQGRGLAGQAVTAIAAYATDVLKLERIVAAVDEPNARSHHLMRVVGFEPYATGAGPVHQLVLYERIAAKSGIKR